MNSSDPSIRRTARDLFLEALDCPDLPQRTTFLDTACAGDTALRAAVDELLAHNIQDSLLEIPAVSFTGMIIAPSEQAGERIGRYRLLQPIGEGGFGVVWMAEQVEPVSRRVALKIIKLGMDTREVIGRFEAERQALAMMDHPNIAQVYDAGATDKGRPYFVMELVKGLPVTQFCDEEGMSVRRRLELFADVCSAISHAHQKGVIHRDIKPSNVMVTLHDGRPVVKVIDFGIAKATEGRLTEKTLFTRFEQILGTPIYMSPEQAGLSGLDADTRSDIYALGILLYELLTGQPAFDAKALAAAGFEEMRRIIREVEPPRPSLRLNTKIGEERTRLAKARQIEPARLRRLVEPDLDWIVMKAIEKDRSRRYATANAFALDIERFLAGETVSATPPSATYQLRKFVRRNKTALRVAVAIAAVLVAATLVSTREALRATRAERESKKNETAARTQAAAAGEQRRIAERNLTDMKAAEAAARSEKTRADSAAESAEQNLFYAQMHLGLQVWREHEGLGSMRELLSNWKPQDQSADRRGWEWYYLSSLPFQNIEPLPLRMADHRKLTLVAWNAASGRIAEGSENGLIRIWDTARKKIELTLNAPDPDSIYWGNKWFDWSPDGGKLAAGSKDGTVRIWETAGGRELFKLEGARGNVVTLAFSPGGERVAAWTSHGSVYIWDAAAGGMPVEVAHHSGQISAGSWSPDGLRLVAGHYDGTITFAEPQPGSTVFTLRAHADIIYHLAWSSDSTRLASTSASDFFVRIWDTRTLRKLLGPLHHAHAITSMAWEPGGGRLATGSMDKTIKVWDTVTGQACVSLRGHSNNVTSLAWSPEKNLASADADGIVKIWNPVHDQEWRSLPDQNVRTTALAWSPDGTRIATASDDGWIRLWNFAAGTIEQKFKAHDESRIYPQFGLIRSLAWSAGGVRLASAGLDGKAEVWNVAGGQEPAKEFSFPAGHGAVWSVAWSPDGRRLAAGFTDGMIQVAEWKDLQTEVHSFHAHDVKEDGNGRQSGVRSLAWSPAGDRLASGGWDSLVKLWDPVNGTETGRMPGHRNWITGLSWSPDGGRIASSAVDHQVIIWDAETCQKVHTTKGHNSWVDAVVWSPDGKRLASAGLDSSVRIWDAASGEETFVLRCDSGMFHDAAWSSDGSRLAGACSDGQIRIWDARHALQDESALPESPAVEPPADSTAAGSREELPPDQTGGTGLTAPVILVPPDSEWKWLHLTDGTDPAAHDPDFHTTFASLAFDDSAWNTGQDSAEISSGFGYGEPDFTGVDIGIPAEGTASRTAWFRRRFTTDRPHAGLELRCRRDDGIVIYIDGNEAARDNMEDGPDLPTLPAAIPVSGGNEVELICIPLRGLSLPAGDHVLSISLHNPAGPSSDLRLGSITLTGTGVPAAE